MFGNGHVAKLAVEVGADLVVDTDTHMPGDFISYEMAYKVALGAGLRDDEIKKALKDNPERILKNKGLFKVVEIKNNKEAYYMNDTIVGILYIIVALLIVVVKYAIPQFFDILIWLIAIGLAATGVYFIMRNR